MSTIYLIRHGKTSANEKHLYCGSTDLPLSETGRAELKKLSYPVMDARFIISGLTRTRQTMEILFGNVPFQVEPGLQEMNFGDFEMHSYEELKDLPSYQQWISGDNEANVTPGGESGLQMQERVLKAFNKIRKSKQDVVLITHGGVIAAIMEQCFPAEHRNRYQWQPQPGHGYSITDGSFRPIP